MQLSFTVALSLLAAAVSAAPLQVTVTRVVTAQVAGQTADATFTPSSTSSSEEPSSTSSQSESSSTGSSGSSGSSFADEMLSEHNNKRSKHGAQSLTWDGELEKYAQDYADQYSCSGSLSHSGGPYGENLAVGYDSATKALDAWYDEIDEYDFSNPGFGESTGHFTQVVWKDSSKLGCAYKDCGGSTGRYIICSYQNPGNVIGRFPQNVQE